MSIALVNIGQGVTGSRSQEFISGDAIFLKDGKIEWIGDSSKAKDLNPEKIVDVKGASVFPGLIDSHVHSTFGDYTPRQNTVGFLDSYVHGGTTSVISASEVHVPGRPVDIDGIKALAVAAHHSYTNYRPGGMRVYAGSIILEPGLTDDDFAEINRQGVWLAKAGFGAFESPEAYGDVIAAAKRNGIKVMFHTGGGSIPGSLEKITVDALLKVQPNISGHCNGGPTALSVEENERLVRDGKDIALQVVHAGNLRSALHISELVLKYDMFHRLMIATDTPTGTGVIPLGMFRQMAEMASLGPLSAIQTVQAATGNVAEVYELNSGKLEVGKDADLVVVDAPLGSEADTALGAIEIGDLPGISCVITDCEIRLTRSRNTPGPKRTVTVTNIDGVEI